MRFQFSTRQILLVTAFVGVTCAALDWYRHMDLQPREPLTWAELGLFSVVTIPIWVPGLFVAYAIGRRKFTGGLVIVFAITEVASAVLAVGALKLLYSLGKQ